MAWVELFAVFLVCHLVGDFVLQTNHQATHKRGGLGRDPVARRALGAHVVTYTLAFVPALVWIGLDRSWGWAVAAAGLIAVPHLIQDDGRLVLAYARGVKGLPGEDRGLMIALDQSFHLVVLFAVALWIGR
jgi:hypothetical protein